MLFAFFLSLAITAAIIVALSRARLGRAFLDFPKARGLHVTPVAKVGGIALFSSLWLLSGLWLQGDSIASIAGLSLVLLILSLADDLKPLSVILRLVVHGVVAIFMVLVLIEILDRGVPPATELKPWLSSPFGFVFSVLAVAWVTNLYNFMDGADGLVGGMTLVGFASYSLALADAPLGGSLGILVSTLAGGGAGFLLFNFPPANVFMGDAGSIPLGFLAAATGLHGAMNGSWLWWFPLLVFSPFIADATATLIRRTLQGNKPWVAHRNHYYQRLILSGWSHRKTALTYYVVMLAAAGSALAARQSLTPYAILLAWVIIYVSLLLLLEWRLRGNNKSKNSDREAT